MPKVLVCASTVSHLRNFHLPYLRFLKEQGFTVHIAVPESEQLAQADVIHAVPITKRIVSAANISAALNIRRLIREERYDLVLVHTTLAAFVVRLGVILAGKNRPRLINTVHGYFFWNGCGLLRRMTYYLPELLLRSVTDCIITMNEEDTQTAQRLVKKGGSVVKVHGMGVDTTRFQPVDEVSRRRARQALDIPEEAFVLVYPAEFSKRKNHIEILHALDVVRRTVPNVLLLLCGTGALETDIRAEAVRIGLAKNIRFLGWQDRMEDIYPACDMAVSTSKSEGLPFNIIEAQLCTLPVIASRIRGHADLIDDGINGMLFTPGNPHELAESVLAVHNSLNRGAALGIAGRVSALRFALDTAFAENTAVYLGEDRRK